MPLKTPSAVFAIVQLGDRRAACARRDAAVQAGARRGGRQTGEAALDLQLRARERRGGRAAAVTSLRSAPLIGTQSRYAV